MSSDLDKLRSSKEFQTQRDQLNNKLQQDLQEKQIHDKSEIEKLECQLKNVRQGNIFLESELKEKEIKLEYIRSITQQVTESLITFVATTRCLSDEDAFRIINGERDKI